MKLKHKIILFAGCVVALIASFSEGSELAIPKFNVVDKYGVNLATGQISQSVNTLSIGGAMGLSHSVSGFTNNFSFTNSKGYHDKFVAKAIYRETGRNVSLNGTTYQMLYTLNVSDFGETAAFLIYVNGVLNPYIGSTNSITSGFTYVALVDTRHKLELDTDTNYLKWTKPDGTVVRFKRNQDANPYLTATSSGLLEQVIYPSGFTINVANSMPSSVRTNTGFQLKYNFDSWNSTMDKANPANTQGFPAASDWIANPHSIQGINAAIEYCPDSGVCTHTKTWPTATFNWPSGMPRSLYINYSSGESGVFSVTDAQNKRTDFHFQAQSLTTDCAGSPATVVPIPSVVPRLIGIKTAESSVVNIHYSFCNVSNSKDLNNNTLIHPELIIDSNVGTISTADWNGGGTSYNIAIDKWHSQDLWNSGGASNVKEVVTHGLYAGNLSYVTTIDGTTNFEASSNPWRNFPTTFTPVAGPTTTYGYDARGNLNSICKNNQCTTANYPTDCPNPKTCNQATWIKDPNLNQTDYTYHQASGQPETVTQPANKNGVRAQVRYEYSQLQAHYYDATGAWVAGTPVWLKTAEKYCANSAYSGSGDGASHFSGVCASNDEVVTRYEYNSNNLFLTGTTVTALDSTGNLKTLRSCFQYDIYGNQIGKTQPKAGLTSCPQPY